MDKQNNQNAKTIMNFIYHNYEEGSGLEKLGKTARGSWYRNLQINELLPETLKGMIKRVQQICII